MSNESTQLDPPLAESDPSTATLAQANSAARRVSQTLTIGIIALLIGLLIPVGDLDGDGTSDITGKWIMFQAMKAGESAQSAKLPYLDMDKDTDKSNAMDALAAATTKNPPRKWSLSMEREQEEEFMREKMKGMTEEEKMKLFPKWALDEKKAKEEQQQQELNSTKKDISADLDKAKSENHESEVETTDQPLPKE
ncbi:MAG: hypothetical protein AAF623_10425 [Planctomycetota bacterium]